MKKYTKLICMIAAVCLLGAAAFCGFRTYANSYGTISERIIQPLKVLYKSMSWYLNAYCTEKQDYRIFKLTRIITLEMLSDTFEKKSFPELDETVSYTHLRAHETS